MAVASNYLENTSTGAEAIYASDNQPDMPEINDVNNLWLLISTALVMLMTPALSLYYGGMVVDGSVLNRMVRTFVSLGIVGVQWLAIGYSLSFASTERAPRLLQKRLYFTLYYSISKGNRALRAQRAFSKNELYLVPSCAAAFSKNELTHAQRVFSKNELYLARSTSSEKMRYPREARLAFSE